VPDIVGDYVRSRLKEHLQVSDAAFEIMVISDWVASVGNGGNDQFFLRHESAHMPQDGLRVFRALRNGVRRFQLDQANSVIEQALRVYAPHMDTVRIVCSEAGLTPMSEAALEDNELVTPLDRQVHRLAASWITSIGTWAQANRDELLR
jgi:hypothetical protein